MRQQQWNSSKKTQNWCHQPLEEEEWNLFSQESNVRDTTNNSDWDSPEDNHKSEEGIGANSLQALRTGAEFQILPNNVIRGNTDKSSLEVQINRGLVGSLSFQLIGEFNEDTV
ncbi:hypothetical protein WICPIJ_005762 [Wickerhamomyces pijperi]|uniref:Uncharacterized protein n=1 Tax=Wickerhamomyces pijperi TaxID=599730 RepID=A0A9P8Q558_WICPI|nr:hypothetical protein WICPIJ_005762 [Wickerhamomyces pijperi]